MNEPIGDAARSILDGHIVLSRKLASSGHYPCVDVLESVSRVINAITTPDQREAVDRTAPPSRRSSRSHKISSKSVRMSPAQIPAVDRAHVSRTRNRHFSTSEHGRPDSP